MNLMLASMLQRGSNEVDIKEKSQETDTEGKEGGSGFSALMAELAEQESVSNQVKESADSVASDSVTSDPDARIDSEVPSSDEPQSGDKAQSASSVQHGEVPVSTVSYTDKGQVVVDKPLPDSPDNDLYAQISAAKQQNTSLSQNPTAISQLVKEALGKVSAADENVATSDGASSEEQLQDEASPLIRGLKGQTENTGTKTAPLSSALASLDSQDSEVEAAKPALMNDSAEAEEQTVQPKLQKDANTQAVVTNTNVEKRDPDANKLAGTQVEDESETAQLKESLVGNKSELVQSVSSPEAKQSETKQIVSETSTQTVKEKNSVATKSTTDVQTIVEKLTVQQQHELKAVMAGKLDIYDASPNVQKAVAQLIGKGVDIANVQQFKAVVPSSVVTQTSIDAPTEATTDVKSAIQESFNVNSTQEKSNNSGQQAVVVKEGERAEKNIAVNKLASDEKLAAEKQSSEKQSSEKQISEKLVDKENSKVIQAEASIVKDAVKNERQSANAATATPTSAKSEASPVSAAQDTSSLNQTLKEVQQIQQSQPANQSTAQTKQATDANLQQAINIARQDAAKELHQRVGLMLNLNNKEAEIRLDPPELGAMQIRIKSDAEQAQVNIVVQNQQAKELLEQSLPRLREMLAEQGIELGDSQISHQQGGDTEAESQTAGGNANGTQTVGDEQGHSDNPQPSQKRNTDSAIDYYA
ncbi:flagellar hook-length control protein FliK [Pseudoalteromonas piscicida]|uniref:Flagellar hook-length control protein FliK n=1 Tax=Pseudoalteromonas piscicida TaxID=43662 RepID=A0AAD0RHM7_PSEO7|nr:flagellar hook-length control protein FliK [Pseudoalteromonas piscicida]ASD67460.1 flagellar hook-length control protein [Pseudoalteromonas piscicida]AXR01839.1 flagellar hook-length control protein FliK [Pseudoalteromonas piscicida]